MGTRRREGSAKKAKPWQFFKCFVERDLLRYKGFCFFIYGAFGSFYPYLPLYFKLFGLSSFQAGIAIGIRPFIQIFGAPFWTTIGENFKAQRLVLVLGILSWLVKGLVIMAIWPQNQECIEAYYNTTLNDTIIHSTGLWMKRSSNSKITWALVDKPTNKSCDQKLWQKRKNLPLHQEAPALFILTRTNYSFSSSLEGLRMRDQSPDAPVKHEKEQHFLSRRLLTIKMVHEHQPDLQVKQSTKIYSCIVNTYITFVTRISQVEIQSLFLIYMLVIIIGEFLESPTFALSDSSMLSRLGDNSGYYGQIRLWGAIGWAISTALVGFLIHHGRYMLCGIVVGNFRVAFYVYIGFVCVALYLAWGFVFEDKEPGKRSELHKGLSALASIKHLSFLLSVLYTGACNGFIFHFINWYIDDRKGSTVVMGIAGVAREVGEFTFFLLGGIIVRFLGSVHAMALCLLSYAACFYCYSMISSPWLAVPLEALDGAIYSLTWSNCVIYMGNIGNNLGIVATMQAILQAVFYGIGSGGGTIVGGALYHIIGPKATFEYLAIGSLVVLAVLLFFYPLSDTCLVSKSKSTREEITPSSGSDSDGVDSAAKECYPLIQE